MNGRQEIGCDTVESKVSVLYDVLNEILIARRIQAGRTSNIVALSPHLKSLEAGDALMADRGFVSYSFLLKYGHRMLMGYDPLFSVIHHVFPRARACSRPETPITPILSVEANAELVAKNTRHRQQVKKAVSFRAIKNSIILLMFDPPPDF